MAAIGRAWYVVQTYVNCENKAKQNLESRIISMNMEDLIFKVFVPEIKRIEKNKKGIDKEVIDKPYPGYVLVDMIVTDESWFMVRNTPMVTGFLGSSGGGAKPVPLPDEEVAGVFRECGMAPVAEFNGEVGSHVIVSTGTFTGQEGVIDSIDMEKQKVIVLIEVFGRHTQTELGFEDVKVLYAKAE